MKRTDNKSPLISLSYNSRNCTLQVTITPRQLGKFLQKKYRNNQTIQLLFFKYPNNGLLLYKTNQTARRLLIFVSLQTLNLKE
jgi:hypothetical protein